MPAAEISLHTHSHSLTLSRAHTQETLSEAVNQYVADNSRLPRAPFDLSQYLFDLSQYAPSRSDENAAVSIVQRQHQQILPPGRQQRFHHVQVPIFVFAKNAVMAPAALASKSHVMAHRFLPQLCTVSIY